MWLIDEKDIDVKQIGMFKTISIINIQCVHFYIQKKYYMTMFTDALSIFNIVIFSVWSI